MIFEREQDQIASSLGAVRVSSTAHFPKGPCVMASPGRGTYITVKVTLASAWPRVPPFYLL